MKKVNKKTVAIVTGASSGFGFEICNQLVNKGYTVYGIANNEFKSENFTYYMCDITNENNISQIFNEIFNKENQIDILVNCAGFGISGSVENTPKQNAQKIIDVNLVATTDLCKQIIPFMRKSGSGKIMNIGSVASLIPIPFQSYYSLTKAGLYSFSLALNNEVRPFNIQVSCSLPGDAKTGFTKNRIKNETENSSYNNRVKNSVKTMEHDETTGMTASYVAKKVIKSLEKKKMPLYKVVGNKYKFFVFLYKILPTRFIEKLLYIIYAK